MAHYGVLMYYGMVNLAHHVRLGKAPGEEARSLLYWGRRRHSMTSEKTSFNNLKKNSCLIDTIQSLNEYMIVTGRLCHVT
jgi:hypothetical protein